MLIRLVELSSAIGFHKAEHRLGELRLLAAQGTVAAHRLLGFAEAPAEVAGDG